MHCAELALDFLIAETLTLLTQLGLFRTAVLECLQVCVIHEFYKAVDSKKVRIHICELPHVAQEGVGMIQDFAVGAQDRNGLERCGRLDGLPFFSVQVVVLKL